MQKKETHLEVFKNALTSTVKSISEKKNCEITFGKPTSNVNNKNKINYIYMLTPKGVSHKTKLALKFMQRKMKEYDELKKELEDN